MRKPPKRDDKKWVPVFVKKSRETKKTAMLLCLAPLGLGLLLAGCGVRTDLKPEVGQSLPVAPFGRKDTPNSAELLLPRPQARPAINVELRLKSEVRGDDPFDLPPP